MLGILLAAVLFETTQGGVDLTVDSETKVIDPAKSVFLTVTMKAKASVKAEMPDLRDRVVGFSLAEDFDEEPKTETDGRVTRVTNWRLVPEPCASVYKVKPFAVGEMICGPIYFEPPAAREPVTGKMEVEVSKDLPPLSWKLVGWVALAVFGLASLVLGLWFAIRYVARRVKEHRMSPIERAWVELDRLLKKGLPGRGRYKDFYVELTMVVRRYVQRKYGIRAPHLTTEEFFAELAKSNNQTLEQSNGLRRFLESADMVKFAGVEATPEMADEATDSARGYLKGDDATPSAAADGNRQPSGEEAK